jgi:hypothetical protein
VYSEYWLKVTAGFWAVLSAMYVMFVGCARSLFGGSSVQQSVPVTDLPGERGQCLSVVVFKNLITVIITVPQYRVVLGC